MVGSVVISFLAGGESIFHQCCNGHRSYAAGHGGDIAAEGGYFIEFNVSFEGEAGFFSGIGQPGDADIYNNSPGFDHGGVDEFGPAEGCDDDIALKAEFTQVMGMGVADGDGAIAGLGVGAEQDAHGSADDIAAADDDGMFATGVDLIVFEEQEDAVRGGGDEGGQSLDHFPDVDGVKAVDVFGGVDGVDDIVVGNMPGQGQLYQDTVYVEIVVEVFDDGEETVLADIIFQPEQGGFEAYFCAGFHLCAYVGFAGAVVADQYCREVGDFFSFCL